MSRLITSVNNDLVVAWSKLKQAKHQRKQGKYIIEEMHIIDEARKANLNMEIIVTEDSGLGGDYIVSDHVMRKISQNESLNEIVALVDISETYKELGNKVIYLDNIQDPGNAGTIIRTAYAFGYDTVVLVNGVSKYNHKLINATKGSIFHMNIIADLDLAALKPEYKLIGTLIDEDALAIEDLEKTDKFVLVFGNEGVGISDAIIELLDQSVYIPMNEFDSLNVGVTAGIVLYYLK